jgi:hypothetical protein
LPPQDDAETLASTLLLLLREGSSEEFIDAFEGNELDFDISCRALASFLGSSQPDDWLRSSVWSGRVRTVLSSYIGSETPNREEFESIFRRWLSREDWRSPDLAPLRDFAGNMLDDLKAG